MLKIGILLVISTLSLIGCDNQPTTAVNNTEVGETSEIKTTTTPKSIEVVTITNEKEILDAEFVNNILSKATKNASKCRDVGGDSIACMCKEKELNKELKQAVSKTLNKYPQWEGNAVYYSKIIEGKVGSNTLSFAGLVNQLEYFSKECK